ncbi:MAG: hypothetical protein LBL95_00010 [Deltaproteobacteria bacterium]|jgi:hypothetical protein|nr:hypothetical protein [Deltaproteobacteria bacterium]
MGKDDDACCDLREFRATVHLRLDAQGKAIDEVKRQVEILSGKLDKFFLVVLSTFGLGVVSLAVGIIVKLLKD